MTIGAIILDCILGVIALFIIVSLFLEDEKAGAFMTFLAAVIIIGGIITFQFWYYRNTASGNRSLKTQESELKNGITRIVKIYDMQGDLIQEYKGKFDITYDESRILFDDENNKRHILYYTTGTVVIDEE